MANWRGSYYQRSDGTWRRREKGFVVKDVRLKKTRGMRNKVIIFNGSNFVGQETKLKNFYGFDAKKSVSAEKAFKKRVMTRQQQKAMFAKKGRK